MNAFVKNLHENLSALEDQLIFSPDELREYTEKWRAGLHRYSFRNYLLAVMQYREATVLAGYRKWQELGRQVKRGEKGIKILTPRFYKQKNTEGDEEELIYFRTGTVFDIKQTGVIRDFSTPWDGKHYRIMDEIDQHIPIGGSQNVVNSGDFTIQLAINHSPYPVKVIEDIQFSDGMAAKDHITIARRTNPNEMIPAIFHEQAHIILGHHGSDLPSNVKEVEAEAVSYIVSSYFGVNNPDAAKYIQHWKGDKSLLKDRGSKIIGCSEHIIKEYEKSMEPKEDN